MLVWPDNLVSQDREVHLDSLGSLALQVPLVQLATLDPKDLSVLLVNRANKDLRVQLVIQVHLVLQGCKVLLVQEVIWEALDFPDRLDR